MLPDFENPDEEKDTRPPEEIALQKAVTKSKITREEEGKALENQRDGTEMGIIKDKEDKHARDVSLAEQEKKTHGFTSQLEKRLIAMESRLSSVIRTYGSKTYKINELSKKIEDSTNELNEIHQSLHEVLISKPPEETRARSEFSRGQKEMASAVRQSRGRLEMEILKSRTQIETLQSQKLISEAEAIQASEALKRVQAILRPGNNTSSN